MTYSDMQTLDKLCDLLTELVAVPGVSGFEEPMIRWCRDRLSGYSEHVNTDVRGNVYVRFPGNESGARRLMFAAHMDTLGLIVKSVDDKGFVRFARETLPLTLGSRRVRIHGAKGAVLGVIGTRVGYGTSTTEQLTRAVGARKLYIDVGCASAEEAEELGIRVGDPVTFTEPLASLGNPNTVVSSYLDNRVGIAALMVLAERLTALKPKCEVVLAATIEEELGLRGAGTLAEKVQPDAAIAVDTVPAGGTPEYDFHAFPIVIGRGPVIKFSENGRVTNHPRMRQLLQFAAEKTNTPHQLAAAPPGGTDMQPIEQSGTGVPAAAIGIPRRYAHSPNEVVDLRDVQGAIEILTESITLFDSGYSLDRI